MPSMLETPRPPPSQCSPRAITLASFSTNVGKPNVSRRRPPSGNSCQAITLIGETIPSG